MEQNRRPRSKLAQPPNFSQRCPFADKPLLASEHSYSPKSNGDNPGPVQLHTAAAKVSTTIQIQQNYSKSCILPTLPLLSHYFTIPTLNLSLVLLFIRHKL